MEFVRTFHFFDDRLNEVLVMGLGPFKAALVGHNQAHMSLRSRPMVISKGGLANSLTRHSARAQAAGLQE